MEKKIKKPLTRTKYKFAEAHRTQQNHNGYCKSHPHVDDWQVAGGFSIESSHVTGGISPGTIFNIGGVSGGESMGLLHDEGITIIICVTGVKMVVGLGDGAWDWSKTTGEGIWQVSIEEWDMQRCLVSCLILGKEIMDGINQMGMGLRWERTRTCTGKVVQEIVYGV